MRPITSDEEAALTRALQEIQRRTGARSTATLEYLVSRWSRFVEEIERGYELSIYDYTNDLCVRDVLDDVIELVPESLRGDIRTELAAWDDRYRLATKPSAAPLLPGEDVVGRARWHRVPRLLDGELKDDLINEGVITK
jgi:hypothetical protein